MLLYKSWLETRWRFTIGLLLLVCSSATVVLTWPRVAELLPLASAMGTAGELGRRIREAAEVQSSYRGYVWSQAFGQNLTNMTTLFAVLLGTGGLLSTSRSAVFTLSLPASRNRIVAIRVATGLAELLLITLVGSFTVTWLSPSVGERYAAADALVHALCLFAAGAVFFALAYLLSTVFADFWRPPGIALAAAVGLGAVEAVSRGAFGYGLFRLMSGETWFRAGQFPWLGILSSLALCAALLWSATVNTLRRDF